LLRDLVERLLTETLQQLQTLQTAFEKLGPQLGAGDSEGEKEEMSI